MRDSVRNHLNKAMVNKDLILVQPMLAGETLDLALRIYRSVGGRLLARTFNGALLSYVGFLFTLEFVVPQLTTTTAPNDLRSELVDIGITIVLGGVVAIPLILIGIAMIGYECISATWSRVSSDVPKAKSGLVSVLTNSVIVGAYGLWPIGLILLTATFAEIGKIYGRDGMAIVAGGLIQYGFWFAVFYSIVALLPASLAPVVTFIEGKKGFAAINRSKQLLSSLGRHPGGKSTVFSLIIRCLMFTFIFFGLFQLMREWLDPATELNKWLQIGFWGDVIVAVVDRIPMFLSWLLFAPYLGIGLTLIYAERRARLEGLDIDLIYERLARR